MNKKDLIKYCLTFKNAYEDYPFDENWAAMRHTFNKKTFAFVYQKNGKDYINLKCEPTQGSFLRTSFESITSAYHMNKFHWITVDLDGDVPWGLLCDMIQKSYDLIKPKEKNN